MAGFDNPLETWNARFAREDFLFGEEPNAFLRTQAHRLQPGGSVLCVADGEGRNSVWLAEQGFCVTAFDFASNAVAKATRLAQRRSVSVSHELGDAYTWPWTTRRYDGLVAVFIQFLPPDVRDGVFAGMKSAVAPGGLFLLEGYCRSRWTIAPAARRAASTCTRGTGCKVPSRTGRYWSSKTTMP